MPDWKQLVRKQMATLELPPDTKEDVIAELALHLEELSENARASGLTNSDATSLALKEVQNWRVLSAEISRARSKEQLMNFRTKSLWLPAMAGILGAGIAVTVLHWIDVRPLHLWTGSTHLFFYWPWLAATPAIGALGAFLSRRAGGQVGSRLLAGLAPALLVFVGSLMTGPIEPMTSYTDYYFYCATNWVLLPGLLLLLGTLPFLQESPIHHEATT